MLELDLHAPAKRLNIKTVPRDTKNLSSSLASFTLTSLAILSSSSSAGRVCIDSEISDSVPHGAFKYALASTGIGANRVV